MLRSKRASIVAGHVLIFLLGFALSCEGLRRATPFPYIPQVSEKLAALSAEGASYNAIFLGSSKINSGIVPPQFDATLAARGVSLHSFNLGIDGMAFPENAFLCEEALRRSAGTVRWVFVELSGIRTVIDQQNLQSRRITYWRDVPRTMLLCRSLLAATGEKSVWHSAETRGIFLQHLQLGFRNFVNLATGADLLGHRLLPSAPLANPITLDPALGGCIPIRRQMDAALLPQYQEEITRFSQPRLPGDPLAENALRELAQRIARAGATAIFIVPPNPYPGRSFLSGTGSSESSGPLVLACDNPQRFPSLYEVAVRADDVHLNETGAGKFTTILAGLFGDYLERTK